MAIFLCKFLTFVNCGTVAYHVLVPLLYSVAIGAGLRLRGASVPFWLVVVWGGFSGFSVAGCLEAGKGTCGYGYMFGFIGLVHTHMHTRTHAKKK